MVRRGLATAAAVLLLAGCSAATEPDASGGSPETVAMLAEHDLGDQTPAEIVDALDRLPLSDRPTDLMASVRVDELVVADGDEEVTLNLPADRFYLSIAPFVNQTHECFYHSLTTCTGELGGSDVQVTIVDDAGEVLVDEETTTFDNGFVGFWLPRDVDGTISVSHEGRTGEVAFSTREDSPTCVTTLQLV